MISPLESGQDSRRTWRHNNLLLEEQNQHSIRLRALETPSNRRQLQPGLGVVTFFPFRIYVFPSGRRTTPDATTDWRKFRVRNGRVVGNTTDPIEVAGTDLAANPDSDTIDEADVTDITVASGVAAYWFWLTIDEGSATATLAHGTTPPATWTLTTIPIGYVNTSGAFATNKQADIQQLLRTDVIIPCLNFPAV